MARLAVFGVGHWHFPLYSPALAHPDVSLASASDPDARVLARVGSSHGCDVYTNWEDQIATGGFDLALVLGRHTEMSTIAAALRASERPVLIEKPVSTSSLGIEELIEALGQAQSRYHVGFHYRASAVYDFMHNLVGEYGPMTHCQFRMSVGSPRRYVEAGCDWMLDPDMSGGGCLMNLGHHLIDMACLATRARPDEVSARCFSKTYGLGVEDRAHVTLAMTGGASVAFVVGYDFHPAPDQRIDFGFQIGNASVYAWTDGDGIHVIDASNRVHQRNPLPLDASGMFSLLLLQLLGLAPVSLHPPAGLHDVLLTVRTIEAAYRSARGDTMNKVQRAASTLDAPTSPPPPSAP